MAVTLAEVTVVSMAAKMAVKRAAEMVERKADV